MPRGTWGALPYGSFSGPYNTVEGDVGAYNTVCVRVAVEYYSVQGMVPSIVVLTCEPCLAFLRTSRLALPYLAFLHGYRVLFRAGHGPWYSGFDL